MFGGKHGRRVGGNEGKRVGDLAQYGSLFNNLVFRFLDTFPHCVVPGPGLPAVPPSLYSLLTSATATSPTTCKLAALTLSMVSSGVCQAG